MRDGPALFNAMHPLHWIPAVSARLLDVGCNVGGLLQHCEEKLPSAQLAGVEVNAEAVARASERVPRADIRLVAGSDLPFPDSSFDCVTSIEVLEHVPVRARRLFLAEISRVLAPGGRLVLRCPHAGLFSWLDVANLRLRFPTLYRMVVGRGLRDAAYSGGSDDVLWHHHFTERELRSFIPAELEVEHVHHGGLLVFPLTDYLRWPFYRAQRHDHFIFRALARLAEWDYGIDYGNWSYGILIVAQKTKMQTTDARNREMGPLTRTLESFGNVVNPVQSLNEQRLHAAKASGGTSSDVIAVRIVEIVEEYDLGGRLLDYGAGVENLTRRLWELRRFEQITAADILPRPGELSSAISWQCLDLNRSGVLPAANFDTVIAAEVIEHLENPREVAREWYRMLKPGGTLVLSTPNPRAQHSLTLQVSRQASKLP